MHGGKRGAQTKEKVIKEEANQQGRATNPESEDCSKLYLTNIFVKLKKPKALETWRKRNAPRNMSQNKGKGRAVGVLQGRR